MNASINYLDGNAAAGELNRIFAMDITTAEGHPISLPPGVPGERPPLPSWLAR
jgi:Family of unknown function (DUF6510)